VVARSTKCTNMYHSRARKQRRPKVSRTQLYSRGVLVKRQCRCLANVRKAKVIGKFRGNGVAFVHTAETNMCGLVQENARLRDLDRQNNSHAIRALIWTVAVEVYQVIKQKSQVARLRPQQLHPDLDQVNSAPVLPASSRACSPTLLL
jgi:hypothetical protein